MAPHFTLSGARVDQSGLSARKHALRLHARRLRQECADQGSALALAIEAYLAGRHVAVVGGYWPIGSEIDPRPALRALAARGAQIALPQVVSAAAPLRFALWAAGEVLTNGPHGTRHSGGPAVRPDLIMVPLLAYDRTGHRLGQGGGYYDRTLAVLPHAVAIGCAYAAQEVDSVPTAPHDIRLHAIATERGVITCRPTLPE